MKEAVADADRPLSVLASFLRTARLAELSSFGRIAEDRLKVVKRLEVLKDAEDTDENDFQQLIADAPWLVNPEWAPVTENQTFSSLRREFEKYYEEKTGTPISLSDFKKTGKRPDFVLSSQEGTVQIIEIKRPHHKLTNPGWTGSSLTTRTWTRSLTTRLTPTSGSSSQISMLPWCVTILH